MKPSRREMLLMLGVGFPALAAMADAPLGKPRASQEAPRLEEFLHLSSVLTGVHPEQLSRTLAHEYLVRLQPYTEHCGCPTALSDLLDRFAVLVKQSKGNLDELERQVWTQILQERLEREQPMDVTLRYLARDITYLWYTSVIPVRVATAPLACAEGNAIPETPERPELASSWDPLPLSQSELGSPEAYLEALFWKRLGTTAPGQCGGAFGQWAKKPR